MSDFTRVQIDAAKKHANLQIACVRGFNEEIKISDEQAIQFLEWYQQNKPEYRSDLEAVADGLYNLGGVSQQIDAWKRILEID